MLALEDDPYLGKPLRGELEGVRSLRVGDYRVIYEIEETKVILHVVAHRKRAYRSG